MAAVGLIDVIGLNKTSTRAMARFLPYFDYQRNSGTEWRTTATVSACYMVSEAQDYPHGAAGKVGDRRFPGPDATNEAPEPTPQNPGQVEDPISEAMKMF